MSLALTKESFFWHKVHSLTGIVPVGFYMVQHLTLNSFSVAGASKFNAVIDFFDGIPPYLLLLLEIVAIWIPLIFHAVYGIFIISRGQSSTWFQTKYKWSQSLMYSLQRYSGIYLFFFLIVHVITTTGVKYATGNSNAIYYAAWHDKFTGTFGWLWLLFYAIGIISASYHLGYGIWNFTIRWGITVSEKAQIRIQKFSAAFFVVITLLGWAAMGGFLLNRPGPTGEPMQAEGTSVVLPAGTVQ